MFSEPGTKLTPAGSGSVRTTSIASSLPVLTAWIVYSITSPASSTPPSTSTADLVDVVKSGRKSEIEVTNAASKYTSPSDVAWIGAEVSPPASLSVTSTTSDRKSG